MSIQYPRDALIAPFLFLIFVGKIRQNKDSSPDYILFNGIVKCRQRLMNLTARVRYTPDPLIDQLIVDTLCNRMSSSDRFSLSHSPNQCFRANESTDVCEGWNPCMSITRLRDGWYDCWNHRDEHDVTDKEIETSCARIRQHRFRCSADQLTCLSVVVLGTGSNYCANGYDNSWRGTRRTVFDMKCDERAKDDCSLLRQYVEQ